VQQQVCAGVAGAGAAAGVLGVGVLIVRCLPMLLPPPKRRASALVASKVRQAKTMVNNIAKRFM